MPLSGILRESKRRLDSLGHLNCLLHGAFKEAYMSLEYQAAHDPSSQEQINIDDQVNIKRWSQALGTTDEALVTAVQAVGTRIDRIKDYLGAGGMAGDQEDA